MCHCPVILTFSVVSLSEMRDELERLKDKFGVNVCGEGGEYETFTLDCPLFKHKLCVTDREIVTHSDDAFAPVHLLKIECELLNKDDTANLSQQDLLRFDSKYKFPKSIVVHIAVEFVWKENH